jgi:peroxiredoxin
MSSLNARLKSFYASMLERVGPEKRAVLAQAAEEIAASRAGVVVPQVGDEAPDFTLPDCQGKDVRLSDVLTKGPVILVFVRGGWCPFCTLTLRTWQEELPRVRGAHGQLLAISPQRMKNCVATAERDMLDFPVLSDHGNKIAEMFGVVHELPEALRPFYIKLGHNLPKLNGTGDWRLPLAATFVVGTDRRVLAAHVDPVVYHRMEPSEAIATIKRQQAEATTG